ncbi:retinol dehydrogenase 13-like isoform X2 [Apostichopus japonicus]|uniref:retinol dehydrogenase 13-like isoform X2 n=1 Tax=Stichopus japonicus TaxID=307972 RepID=UPI003AB723DF
MQNFVKRVFSPRIVLPLSLAGTVVGSLVLIRDHFGGGTCQCKVMLKGRTVIITGANTGIGKETALDLAKRGGRIILACRDEKKALKARKDIILQSGNTDIHFRHLDLASLKSVRSFAERINSEEDKVHVLINNAGIMRCPFWKTEDGFEMQFGVNHLGHFLLTNLLRAKLQSSSPSRIINVSSIAHERGKIDFENLNSEKDYQTAEAYANSKLANVLFNRELSKELQGTGVTANAVHPGIVNTEIGRYTGFHKSGFSMTILGPIFWLFVKSPKQGAQTTIHCAISEDLESTSGLYFSDCKPKECSALGKEDQVAKRLWDTSIKLVGLDQADSVSESS